MMLSSMTKPYSVARHTGQFLGIPLQPYEGGYQLLRNVRTDRNVFLYNLTFH